MKKQFVESRNCIVRAESCRKVSSAFFCIHCEDIMKVVNHDLQYCYVFFGRALFVNIVLGITKGSRVSPGIADIVLLVIGEINSIIFTFEAKRWLIFIIRWVDDIWISLVCFLSNDLFEFGMDCCRLSATSKCEQRIDMLTLCTEPIT